MQQSLTDSIKILIEKGKEFEKVNFLILFFLERNRFFYRLRNYIAFYNSVEVALKQKPYKNKRIENIKPLKFEDYSLNPFVLFLVLLTIPISILMLVYEWQYIKRIKAEIRLGILEFEKL